MLHSRVGPDGWLSSSQLVKNPGFSPTKGFSEGLLSFDA
jgi:hypothetical protein